MELMRCVREEVAQISEEERDAAASKYKFLPQDKFKLRTSHVVMRYSEKRRNENEIS